MMENIARDLKWQLITRLQDHGHKFDSWDVDSIMAFLMLAIRSGFIRGQHDTLEALVRSLEKGTSLSEEIAKLPEE